MDSSTSKVISDSRHHPTKPQASTSWVKGPTQQGIPTGFSSRIKKAILQEIKYIASWSMKFIQEKRSSNSWKYKIQVDRTITQPKIVNI